MLYRGKGYRLFRLVLLIPGQDENGRGRIWISVRTIIGGIMFICLIIIMVIALILMSARFLYAGMYCGERYIMEGDSAFEVGVKCGRPWSVGFIQPHVEEYAEDGRYFRRWIRTEVWVYPAGDNVNYVYIKNGRVIRIGYGPYGRPQ